MEFIYKLLDIVVLVFNTEFVLTCLGLVTFLVLINIFVNLMKGR